MNHTGMIIEIGERIAPEKGDKGDIGYPGMIKYCNSPFIWTWMNKLKNNIDILGLQGEDGALGAVGLPGLPGESGEKGETGADGFPVRTFYMIFFVLVLIHPCDQLKI